MLRSNQLGKVDLAAISFETPGGDAYAPRELKGPARLLAADTYDTSAPGSAAGSPRLRDPRFQRVGVGVALAGESQRGNRHFWIAVIYTD